MSRNLRIGAALMAAGGVAALAIGVAAGSGIAPARTPGGSQASLATQLAQARLATAKYATNLGRAKADGYGIITRMIPNMGFKASNHW